MTLRELVEEGLNLAVDRRRAPRAAKLKLPVVRGQGLTPKAELLGMKAVLALAASGGIDVLADESEP